MDERAERTQEALQSLRQSIRDLEARVAKLEGAPARSERAREGLGGSDAPDGGLPLSPSGGLGFASVLSLAGRTFLILGGGFLLRALTDSAVLPRPAGILAGLVYALLWAVLAGRASSRGHPAAAGFQAFASAIIAYPLVWEATMRFAVLSPDQAALTVAAVTGVVLGIALRQGSPILASVFTVASAATSLGLLFGTGAVAGFAVLAVAIGVASLWLGYIRGWDGPRWFAALVANLAVLRLLAPVLRATHDPAADPSLLPIEWIALGYLLAYLGSFAVWTLARRRDVGIFEMLQSGIVLALGLGGAARVSFAVGVDGLGLGLASLLAGAGCYTVAFVFVGRRAGGGRNFFFYSSLGLVLLLAGCELLGGIGPCTLVWGILAIAAAAVGGRYDRVTLRAHAAVYAVAAAVESGLFAAFADAAVGPLEAGWRDARWAPWALGATLVAYGLLLATRSFRNAPRLARLPRTVLVFVSLVGLATALVIGGMLLTGRTDGTQLATIRTFVLALGAVGLAAAYSRAHLPELAWFSWGLLGVGALKLVLEDLRAGGAGPLFLAFAAYGLALIVTPRLLRAHTVPPAA